MTDPFTYIPPTEATAPRHAAITAAERAARSEVDHVIEHDAGQAAHARISDALRAFFGVIQEHAPASADRSAAERCVRIARMAANAAIAESDPDERGRCIRLARDNIRLAGWQARAAVALGIAS